MGKIPTSLFGITARGMDAAPIQDVTDQARTLIGPEVIKAEQQGRNVLVLSKLDRPNNISHATGF